MSSLFGLKPYVRATLLLSSSFLCLPALALEQAQPSTEALQTFSSEMLEHHIVPRYQVLERSAENLAKSTQQLCASTDDAHLEKARLAFGQTMEAWQGIQHIRSGPIEMMMRNYSMQFWPDKKNHVGKHLSELIAEKKPEKLLTDDFYSITVAVRGLPAIERLLYDDNATEALRNDSYRCQVLERISAYVYEMGQAVTTEWQEEMTEAFASAGADEESLYSSQEEVAVLILKPIVETLEVVKDLKIKRAMGSELDMVKYKRLESWRSGRSLDNIKANISAVKAIYTGENGSQSSLRQLVSTEHQKTIDTLFADVEKQLTSYQEPMESLITTADGYAALTLLADDVERLLKAVEAAIGDSGIFLGFNSRDGD